MVMGSIMSIGMRTAPKSVLSVWFPQTLPPSPRRASLVGATWTLGRLRPTH